MSNRVIFYSKKAEAKVKHLVENTKSLSALVIEAFETNPVILLSPVIRKIILEKAKIVDDELLVTGNFLCADMLSLKDDDENTQART